MRIEKFRYRGFDEPHQGLASQIAAEAVADEPEPVLVSEEIVEEARKQAFEAGVVQGFHEGIDHGRKMAQEEAKAHISQAAKEGADQAITSHHKQVEMTLGLVNESLRSSLAEALASETTLRQDMIQLALGMAQKLAGAALQAAPLAAIEQHLTETLRHCEDVPTLAIRVAPELAETIKTHCQNYAVLADYRGVLTILPDPSLQPGDSRVEWQFGYAERRQAALLKALEETITRHFPASHSTPHENGA